MKSSALLALATSLGAYAAPASLKRDTATYDIILSKSADVAAILSQLDITVDDESVTSTYNNSFFKGFSGSFSAEQVEKLNGIAEVSIVDSALEATIKATRSSAPWGLQRISQTDSISNTASPSSTSYTYTYSSTALGSGVDIYIVDTGIRTSHTQFGSRATVGWSAFTSQTDDNGHGTHVSGTSAGNTVGVASNANLIGVKVLDASGSGTSSGLIGGIDYVASQHESRSGESGFVGSVASLSLGFNGRSTAVESALVALSDAGVHIAVAAGNDGDDASNYTPGSLGGDVSNIISVGAANILDEVAYFSNSGPTVDLYAPGVTTYSSYYNSDTAYAVASGTSMATPHISGLLAYLLASDSSLNDPATLKAYVKSLAVSGYLTAGDADVTPGGELIIAQNGASGSSSTVDETETTQAAADEEVIDLGIFY
ncbi:putative peptidase s8 s53 subtilisin kexin sedolisin protein [Lasiodiplodia theobromae]|uniref:Cerevisin n=1 Tax=Lasiodiplodia theobromae TaxID=45133 RepID=A0A5N5DLW0_9PEZI|nr:Peptidase S8/S53 subtilisin/kexin/sedolisin [Lasiodiplodia theobromae]KAB2578899.1 Cerevisin [Lasiodiplodia theobromae]KAF4546426.1 Peptidase S8/S53 subtilisin/kexin/sedolisin [Lasiodiplodia theobromae]KAF9630566.1 putative peptidase s8 s53 subtilisin kexin sedolisin protein [Lasiodiplodia theobromae]